MQSNEFRRLSLVKMAFHRITNLAAQRIHGIRFRENGMAQSPGGESALVRFFDEKDEFVHLVRVRRPLTLPITSAIRRPLSRILSASWAGGRWVMSSLDRGFLLSRLHPLAKISAAETFQARSFSCRFVPGPGWSHDATSGANSSSWMGAVLVLFFRPSGSGCSYP